MKNHGEKGIMHLVIAGLVLLAVNAWVWMGVQNGQLSPVGNPMLWGTFMVLNMVSLLWAVGLLGLQPLVVACSYAAGGFLAYRGVQGVASISVAEVTTAGATYGAIGALAVGNLTTKVRMAFFRKGQVPFIFVIVGLLVVDGVLNSQVSGAGWSVILNVLVFPFVLAGIMIGLIWMVVSCFVAAPKPHIGEMPVVEAQSPEEDDGTPHLMIQVPDTVEEEDDEPEGIAAMAATPDPEPILDESLSVTGPVLEPTVEEAMEEESSMEHFFPLEIDKDDGFVPPGEGAGLIEPAVSLEEDPEPLSKPEPIPEVTPDPEPTTSEPVYADPEPEDKKSDDDWLSGHLDLLNKISDGDE